MRVLIFCLFVIFSIPVFSQSIQADSLASIINSCQPFAGDSCQTIIQEIIKSTKNNSNKYLYPEVLMHVANVFIDIGDFEKAEQLLLESKAISESLEATDLVANSSDLLGTIAISKGDFENALTYIISSAKMWEQLGNQKELAKVYLHLSSVFFDTNELQKAQKYDRLVKGIAEDLDDDHLRTEVLAGMATYSMTYGIHYYLQNEQDTSKLQKSLDTLDFYFKKSEVEHYEALAIARKIGYQEKEVNILNNLVALTLNMENYEKGLELAKESEILAESNGDIRLIIQSKFNIGSAYRRMGNLDMAAKYGEESLALAKENGLERKEFLANRILYELYKTMGNYSKANLILEEMRAYDKRIGDAERNKALAEVEAQYDLVKKEKEIVELGITNAKVKRQRNSIFGGALLLGLFSFLIFQFMKVRKERNDKMAFAEALIFAQEEERKRIARDLHDGVGQSLLLIKKQMASTHEVTVENQQMISDTLEEVRTISRDLHPFQLEKFGLTASINDVIEKIERSTDLFMTKEIINIDANILKKNQIHIFRAIQEALSNIVKHAEATAAKLTMAKKVNELVIKIMDNGKGYDHELTVINSKSLGIRTMHERISSIGGRLKIEQNVPSGTILTFTIPKK